MTIENTRTMKERPESERPYEKCLLNGPASLSDAELLAVILRSGLPGRSVLTIAEDLILRFGQKRGLGFLMEAERRDLEAVPGIGSVKATELLAVGELSRRIRRSRAEEKLLLNSPDSIADYFMEDMTYLPKEQLVAAMFNTKNRLVHTEVISVGTVDRSVASPREIFLAALRCQAVFLVLLHNHPSGDPTPSPEDVRLTGQLAEAGTLLGIPLMDHIIIGDHRYVSMRESGLLGTF